MQYILAEQKFRKTEIENLQNAYVETVTSTPS